MRYIGLEIDGETATADVFFSLHFNIQRFYKTTKKSCEKIANFFMSKYNRCATATVRQCAIRYIVL